MQPAYNCTLASNARESEHLAPRLPIRSFCSPHSSISRRHSATMSSLTAVICAILVCIACARLVPPQIRPSVDQNVESNLPINQRETSQQVRDQLDGSNKTYVTVAPIEKYYPEDLQPEDVATETTSTVVPESIEENNPLSPSVSHVPAISSLGAVRYAYHGQTEHAVDSSQVLQTATSNVRAFPVNQAHELHFNDVPAAFYHSGQIPTGGLLTAHHDPANAYIQSQRPQFYTTGQHYLTSDTVPTFGTVSGPITHYAHVHPRPAREQTFTVNVASPKYGYGYSIHGIQHAE